jgi:hypothetical protein
METGGLGEPRSAAASKAREAAGAQPYFSAATISPAARSPVSTAPFR